MTQRHAFIIAQSRLIAGAPSVLFSIVRKPLIAGAFFCLHDGPCAARPDAFAFELSPALPAHNNTPITWPPAMDLVVARPEGLYCTAGAVSYTHLTLPTKRVV